MFWQRLEAIGAASAQHARAAGAAVWAGLVFAALELWIFCRWVLGLIKRFVLWLCVPSSTAPFDVLKHCVAVLTFLIGVVALAWSVRQILYPPLVITVAELPAPLKQEYWINPELARTLIGQVERIRNTVKDERDPTFEAVLSPPNIVINTGGWSLNVQEQILTPIGTLLGRGQGEVHLSLTCYHPGCVRTTDDDCNNPIPKNAEKVPTKQYLCLRLTADIHRDQVYRSLSPRLVLGNDEADLTNPMSRVAEAVTAVSDPATAALYFYRRMREERAATTSFTNVPDIVAELFNEASKAAEQAENSDAVSACWAHSVRAHLAIDRREFAIAQTFLDRAREIRWWRHLWQLTLPVDCDRLRAIAEMEFARQLARRSEERASFLTFKDDNDDVRVLAAYQRIERVLKESEGIFAAWADFISRSASSRDVRAALRLARSEIGLNFFTPSNQCKLITDGIRPEEFERDPDIDLHREAFRSEEELEQIRTGAWDGIHASISAIRNPKSAQLASLTRQATLDFLQQYALNTGCADKVIDLAGDLFMYHANDYSVGQLLVAVTEASALRKTEMLNRPVNDDDRLNPQLGRLRLMYQRIVDTGADRSGNAINKLAYIAEAIKVDRGGDKPPPEGERRGQPNTETMQNLTRAWRRYQRERYPAETRSQAEYAVAFWASVLMRSYPPEFLTRDEAALKEFHAQLEKEDPDKEDGGLTNKDKLDALPGFLANHAELQQALRTLYPTAQTRTLAELPGLPDIGQRIGCMCMLSYVTLKHELADFFVLRLNRWQQVKLELPVCRRDLIPRMQLSVRYSVRRIEQVMAQRLKSATDALARASATTPQLQQAVERARVAHDRAKVALEQAEKEASESRGSLPRKRASIALAEELCHMAQKKTETETPAPEQAR
jgi:hypothetical protein